MRNTRKDTGRNREPLRRFHEIAASLGITQHQLQGHIRRSAIPAPTPEFTVNGKAHFRPSLFQAWWEQRQQEVRDGQA